MNFIENETPEKLRGAFYTDGDIARFLARWVLEFGPTSVLEPSCGDGAFLAALDELSQAVPNSLRQITAWEIDPAEAAKAQQRTRGSQRIQLEVHEGDFLKQFVS